MNKIFKLFSVLTVLLLVMGLSSCIFIDAGGDPENFGNIDSEDDFLTFMGNGSKFAKLTASFSIYEIAVIPEGKEKTLDLNGCEVTYAKDEEDTAVVLVNGTLTVNDTHSTELTEQGAFINNQTEGIAIGVAPTGNVVINAGRYEVTDGYALLVKGKATVTKGKFDGGTSIWVNGTGVVEELAGGVDVETDYIAVKVASTARIKKLGGMYSTVGTSANVYGLFNDGTIDDITGACFWATGSNNVFGMKNTGTISRIYDSEFTCEQAPGGTYVPKNINTGTIPAAFATASDSNQNNFDPEITSN